MGVDGLIIVLAQ